MTVGVTRPMVGKALLDESVRCPDLTALTEGTEGVVFNYVRESLSVEIDSSRNFEPADQSFFWRELVLAACRVINEEWEEPLAPATCEDFGEWDVLIECLETWILWDYDFAMDQEFLDKDPEPARVRMREMGIPENYF